MDDCYRKIKLILFLLDSLHPKKNELSFPKEQKEIVNPKTKILSFASQLKTQV